MSKRWVGYVDIQNNKITSAVLAEIDIDDMPQFQRNILLDYEHTGKQFGRYYLIEEISFTKIYFIIDNLHKVFSKKLVVDRINTNKDILWPVTLEDIHQSYEEAREEIFKNRKIIFKEMFHGRR